MLHLLPDISLENYEFRRFVQLFATFLLSSFCFNWIWVNFPLIIIVIFRKRHNSSIGSHFFSSSVPFRYDVTVTYFFLFRFFMDARRICSIIFRHTKWCLSWIYLNVSIHIAVRLFGLLSGSKRNERTDGIHIIDEDDSIRSFHRSTNAPKNLMKNMLQ